MYCLRYALIWSKCKYTKGRVQTNFSGSDCFCRQREWMRLQSHIQQILSHLWEESYDKPRQHSKKQRHHSVNKGLYSQSYDSSRSHIWMWDLDHKTAEHRRIYAFELRCLRRLLRVPWTTRRSNQSILKEISPEYSLEGLDKAEAPILRIRWPTDVLLP